MWNNATTTFPELRNDDHKNADKTGTARFRGALWSSIPLQLKVKLKSPGYEGEW